MVRGFLFYVFKNISALKLLKTYWKRELKNKKSLELDQRLNCKNSEKAFDDAQLSSLKAYSLTVKNLSSKLHEQVSLNKDVTVWYYVC